jgi:hypothetical protein
MVSTVQDRFNIVPEEGIKHPCRMATTVNITLSGLQTIDGVVGVENDRVLVKDQADASENGIWVMQTTAWVRASDWDDNTDVVSGMLVSSSEGSIGSNVVWVATFSGTFNIDTTLVSFSTELEFNVENHLWQGSFQIWQRGISFNSFASRKGVADGWSYARSSFTANSTVSQQAGINQQYSIRVLRDSGDANTNSMNLVANMSRDKSIQLAGREITLKYRAKKGSGYSGSSDQLFTTIRYTTHTSEQTVTLASGQYSTGDELLSASVDVLTSSFQAFSLTATIPANATQILIRHQYVPVGTAIADDYFEIEEVAIVIGPGTFEPIQIEFSDALSNALLEYRKSYSTDTTPGSVTEVGALVVTDDGTSSSASASIPVQLGSPMRALPTITAYSTLGTSGFLRNLTDGVHIAATVENISHNGFTIIASTLNKHYEESSFTPALVGATVSHTGQVGDAKRIGSLMFIDMEIDYNTLDTADTSDIQISGFPVAAAGKSGSFNVNLQTSTGATFALTDYVVPTLYASGTAIALTAANGTNWDYNDGKLAAAGKLVISGSYPVSNASGLKRLGVHYEAEARL